MIISKKQLIGVVAIGILLAGVVFFIWWVSKGRFIQTTDDAYIGGNITTVTSKVSGYISAIEVRDNQSVKKGDIILRLDDRECGQAAAVLDVRCTLEQTGVQIEYVAGVRLTSWRTVKQKGKCTVSYRVLGQIVVNDQNVLCMKNSPIEQPAYGAMYCSGADSDAVAATMQV